MALLPNRSSETLYLLTRLAASREWLFSGGDLKCPEEAVLGGGGETRTLPLAC